MKSIYLFFSCNVYYSIRARKFNLPSTSILQLADFQRTPSVSMNSKKIGWFSLRPTYKTLDDLNQEEMKLAGLHCVNPFVTNISSSVTYISNLKVRKFNEKQKHY